jgi:succinate dehydrogenase / fumarate reductase cytochrome b subunit
MRYAYYPGCYAKGTAPELDSSTRAVCERLGIELEELTAAPCCGAGDVQQVDGPLAQGLNELTLAQAQHLGLDILTVCNVCTLSLRQANLAVEESRHLDEASACLAVADPGCPASADPGSDAASPVGPGAAAASPLPAGAAATSGPVPPGFGQRWPLSTAEAAAAATAALAPEGLAYAGGVGVTHLLWALWKDVGPERMAEQVTQGLSGLTLAPFYGCQILRPADVNDDDVADDPTALEDLVAACGAASVDYDGRLKCCGWPIMYIRQSTATTMAARVVRNAAAAGADAIVTPCPLCHAALEGCQSSSAAGPERLRLPVLHLPQMIGLALGCSPRRLGLIDHAVDTRPLLARLGLTLT